MSPLATPLLCAGSSATCRSSNSGGRFSKPTGSSWRMDETAVSVRGRWHYLYRAVDRDGKSVHSLLCEDRTVGSAQEFFRQAVRAAGSGWPEKINLDGNAASHRGLRLLGDEDPRWQTVMIRARRYLNNIVEQDHRAIKQRCASMLGFKSFGTAAITFSGIELAHRIRKRQFAVHYERNGRAVSLKVLWEQALSDQNQPKPVENTVLPLTHQNSNRYPHPRGGGSRNANGAARYPRKLSFGQSLYLLIMPKGSRYWRYRYRFQGREKMISLGCYPDVPTASAWARHRLARQLVAQGVVQLVSERNCVKSLPNWIVNLSRADFSIQRASSFKSRLQSTIALPT
jgi:transposase-like protein